MKVKMKSIKIDIDKPLLDKAVWLLEYDLPSESKGFTKKQNQVIRALRNKIVFLLEFKLYAQKNLQSSWFIHKDKVDLAEQLITELIMEYEPKIPNEFNLWNRIKLIPIFLTKEGHEHYENKKVEFILQFIGENTELVSKGIKKQKLSEGSLWRAKKCSEIFQILRPELKKSPRFNEIEEAINLLDDLINEYEQIKLKKKNQEEK